VALSFLRRLKLSIVILRIGLKASDNQIERAKHAAFESRELLARLRAQGI
jgi:hypothetical protein